MGLKHIEQVLTTTGLTADQVKALNELKDDAADFKVDDYVNPIKTGYETALKNDPKFYEGLKIDALPEPVRKELQASQYGRAASEVRATVLKNAGLTEDQFADLGDEGKKITVFIPALVKKLAEGKITDAELQKKLVEMTNKVAELEQQTPTIEKTLQEKYDSQLATKVFDLTVGTKIASIPGLQVGAEIVTPGILNAIKNKYALVNVDGAIELRQKANNNLKPLSADGKKELTLDDAIMIEATAAKIYDPKKKTEKIGGTTSVDIDPEKGGGLAFAPHLKAQMEKRLEEDKKALGQS